MDMMGTNFSNAFNNNSDTLKRLVIDFTTGVYIGEWIDEEDEVDVNTVLESMNKHWGCRVQGKLEVNKSPGLFRIFPKESLGSSLL